MFEQTNDTFRYPVHGESVVSVNPSHQEYFVGSYDPSYSYMPPVLCNYCESPNHDTHTCPFHAYIDATCASFEKKINEMTDQMIETTKARIAACSQCFNQNRETYSELDSNLGSPKADISLYDDFEHSYSTRPDLNEDMYLPSLDQERDLPMSLSPDLAPCTSSPKGITDDVRASANPPPLLTTFVKLMWVNNLILLVN